MIYPDLIISAIVLFAVFTWYFYLALGLADCYLDGVKFKNAVRIPIAIFNVVVSCFLVMWEHGNSVLGYLAIFLLLFAEMSLFYKGSYKKAYFMALGFLIHFAAIRLIVTSIFAIVRKTTLFDIANTNFTLIWSMIITIIIIDILCSFYKKIMPPEKICIVLQHDEQRTYVNITMSIFNGYFLLDAMVFSINKADNLMVVTHIVLPVVLLIGAYVITMFSFRACDLLGYRNKSIALEQSIISERQLKQSLINDSVIFYEINLTNDKIIEMPSELMDIIHEKYPEDKDITYSKAIKDLAISFVEPSFIDAFINNTKPDRLIEELKQGNYETSFDYKRLSTNGKYVWVRASTYLFQDPVAEEMKGFMQVKNIDDAKEAQIALQKRAEADSLTGLLNKATTERLITEYITTKKFETTGGVMFMIDVDDFKRINDEFGHLYGDEVLQKTGRAMAEFFRSEDILGRIGGDEFMAFMKNNDINIAESKATQICELFNKNEQNKISYSIGFCIAPKDGVNFETLYKKADRALYESKNRGKNTYTIYCDK